MCSDLKLHHHTLTQMLHFSAKSTFLCSPWETCSASSLDRLVSEWNLYLKQTYVWGNVRAWQMSSERTAQGEQEQGSVLFWGALKDGGGHGCRWQKQRRPALMKAAHFDIQRLLFPCPLYRKEAHYRRSWCFQKITLYTLLIAVLLTWKISKIYF